MVQKFAFFFLVALCVMEGQASHLSRKQPELKSDIHDVLQKIEHIVHNMYEIIGKVYKELDDKLNEILANSNLENVSKKIKDVIAKAVDNEERAKECIEAQKEAIEKLAQDVIDGAKTCVFAAKPMTETMKWKIVDQVTKFNKVRQDIFNQVQKCFNENPNNPVKQITCLKSKVNPITEELLQIEKETNALLENYKKSVGEILEELGTCMSHLQKTTQVGEEKIIADIKKCTENIHDILQINEHIVNNIYKVVGIVYTELDDKLNEIFANNNLENILKEIKDIIENAVGNEEHAEECIRAQERVIEELAQDVKNGTGRCIGSAKVHTEYMKRKIVEEIAKYNNVRWDFLNRVQKCFNENPVNPVGYITCFKSAVSSITGDLLQIEKETTVNLEVYKKNADEILENLETCMLHMQKTTQAGEEKIIADIKKCTENSS